MRAMRPSDVTTFATYRNLPDVARYQDWELPYTRDLAHQLIDEMDGLSGPRPGEWVQLAIDDIDGSLVGDLAVFVDADVRMAMIGYTVDPAHQGLGYATEAAGALVDRLFDRLHVHRVAATLDPANVSSARVLERLGFRYEGRGVKAAYVRGEWADDDRYAILADERLAWRERPKEPPSAVRLVEITPDNVYRVARLATHHSQQRFVATMPQSYTDALVPEIIDGHPLVPWMRAIEADGELVGFVMLAARTDVHLTSYLWRLLVDARHQGRGIGARALRLVGEHLAAQGDTVLETSWVDAPGGPEGFYRKLGFEPTGEIDDGEIVASIPIARLLSASVDHAEV
ncbi:MAG TPA: GNAT family N-acetyltransferase [Ilumatobacteraceae bacterium]|nr:GNAT family N-acetyltransferase [Ilumatobacteraceae bacterium]